MKCIISAKLNRRIAVVVLAPLHLNTFGKEQCHSSNSNAEFAVGLAGSLYVVMCNLCCACTYSGKRRVFDALREP